VGIAVAVRLVLLRSRALELDADEAVTGLVARQIGDGHHRAFFPGQHYMGTAEQYLQAAVLRILPDTDLVLRLPQVALGAAASVLVWAVAATAGWSRNRAYAAAAAFAVGPYFSVYWGTKSRGAYASATVLGMVGLWLALTTSAARADLSRRLGLFGLVCGVAFWQNQQTAFLLVPAAWWMLATVRHHRAWAATWAAALGFGAGASPALWHAITSGAGLFAGTTGSSSSAERAQHLLVETLPDLLGLRDEGRPLVGWLPPAYVVAAALIGLGAAIHHRRRGLLAVLALRTEERCGLDLLLLVLATAPVLFVLSGTATTATARFAYVLYPVLLLLLAAIPVPAWTTSWLTGRELAAGFVLASGLHTLLGAQLLIDQDDGGHPVQSGQVVRSSDVDEVVAALRREGIRAAYADYWLAHPLTWRADGEVLVESLITRRLPEVSAAVSADPAPALVVPGAEVAAVTAALQERGSTYSTTSVAGWWIVSDIRPAVRPGFALTMPDAIRGS